MCHGDEGKGQPPAYPPLAGNQSITMSSPVNSIRMVLNGGYPPGTRKNPRPYGMPPFCAHPQRRRGRRRRHLHPRRLGEQRHAGRRRRRPTSCASCCPSEGDGTMPATRLDANDGRGPRGRRDRRRGPSGAFAVAGIATAIVVAIYFALLLLRLPAARRRAVSTALPRASGHDSHAVAAAAERRWAFVVGAIIALLVAMMIFTGLHWASMPPSRVETVDVKTLHTQGRVRREQSRHERRRRRQGDGAPDRAAVFVRAAVHRRAGRHAGDVPRHEHRRDPRLHRRHGPTPTRC